MAKETLSDDDLKKASDLINKLEEGEEKEALKAKLKKLQEYKVKIKVDIYKARHGMLLNEELEKLIPKVKYKQMDEYIDLAIDEYNHLNKEVQDYLEEIEFIKGLKEELKGFTIVAKEMEQGQYFNLDLGFSDKIWVQIENDEGIVGEGGITENDGVATINLTIEGDYWIVVKESNESVEILERRPLKVLKEKLKDLDKEIKEAENTTIAPISEDGKDIYSDQKWTKQEDKDNLDLAISESKSFFK